MSPEILSKLRIGIRIYNSSVVLYLVLLKRHNVAKKMALKYQSLTAIFTYCFHKVKFQCLDQQGKETYMIQH